MLDIKGYYSDFVRIWSDQYDAYWKSVNVFLIIQGILFAAVVQVVIQKVDPIADPTIALAISCIGLPLSFMWLFIGKRKVVALQLMEHQLRHLELELFAKRVVNLESLKKQPPKDENKIENAIEKVFPMYFVGARAVLLRRDKKKSTHPSYPYEKDIKKHHLEEIPDALSGFGAFSRIKIMTFGIPLLFVLSWAAALGVSLGEIVRMLL